MCLQQEEMSKNLFGLRVPIETDIVVGKNWGSTHEIEDNNINEGSEGEEI